MKIAFHCTNEKCMYVGWENKRPISINARTTKPKKSWWSLESNTNNHRKGNRTSTTTIMQQDQKWQTLQLQQSEADILQFTTNSTTLIRSTIVIQIQTTNKGGPAFTGGDFNAGIQEEDKRTKRKVVGNHTFASTQNTHQRSWKKAWNATGENSLTSLYRPKRQQHMVQ